MQQPVLNPTRRRLAAARFHHGSASIPDLAHEYRVARGTIGDATREFSKHETLIVWQSYIGGC